ncbi:hypothetical protein IFR05_016484 [Cadophora sp. M221]|nr:hypothetical protein IFR05_016484 [Cadophora sp. M221]
MSPFEECQSTPDAASSKNESDINGHGSFDDMLDDFGKLQIECHGPSPVDEQRPTYHGSRKSHILCIEHTVEIDMKDISEIDNQARGDLPGSPVADQDADPPVFNTLTQIEDYETRQRTLWGMSNGLTDLSASVEKGLPDAPPYELSDSSSSDESEEFHPEDMELPEPLPAALPLDSESILDEQHIEETPAGNSVLEATPGPRRELITKRDGSRFIVTGMHDLSGYMPTDQRCIAELPFGSFGIKKLKCELEEFRGSDIINL